jgi:glycosyltransferase involved in cell wall biosynthesis
MPLKICHLDTELSWRGGEQQLLYLVSGLKAAGDDNVIAVKRGSALAARARADGFKTMILNPRIEWDPAVATALRRELIRGGFQILHTHTAHAAALGALATIGTKIPLVVSRRVDFHSSKNPFTRWKYRRAAKILAVSSAVRETLIQDGIPASQVIVVYDGIDLARLEKDAPLKSRQELGLPVFGPLIGQIAALAPEKDPLNFLQSIALLKKDNPDIRGVMVGVGPMEKEVEREVIRLNLSGTVSLLGFRPDAHRILRHFDVFVFSSATEGLGTSILDALALGVPVVATRAGGIPEIIKEGVSGLLVSPQNPEALAAAVLNVLRDSSLREKFQQEGYKTVQRFGAAAMVEGTRLIYREILTRNLA